MKIKNIMANVLCATLIISNLTVTSASNIIISEMSLEDENIKSEEYVVDTNISEDNISDTDIMPLTDDKEEYETPNSIEEIKVTYTQVSNYSVSIPKTISLDKNKQGTYSIKVTGNIDAIQQVHIEPIDNVSNEEGINFYMKDTTGRKANVLATVNQNKIYWDAEEAANGYEETNNTISAPRLTSGSWEGIFQIKISLESKDHEHNYVDGICTECGEIDPNHTHNYVDGTCTICGQEGHVHNFVNGKCDCGELDPNHEHTYTETITTNATCTTDGEKKLSCSCGDTKTETIPATGHNYGDDDHCTDCGTLNPNHEHNYTETITTEATCTENGEKRLTCSCGDTKTETIPATGHSYGDDDHCTDCGTLNPNHEHSYSEQILTEATCTTNGSKKLTCICGDSKNEIISALGHNYASTFTTDREATCTIAGEKSKHCTRCDSKTEVTSIESLGHNIVNNTCTICNKSYQNYAIAPTNAIENWNYKLNDSNHTITLNYYTGSETNVIVYANYPVNGKTYETQLANNLNDTDNTAPYMFNGSAQTNCQNIKSIVFSKDIDTSNLTNVSYMFKVCKALTNLDVSGFDTGNITNMQGMFWSCSSLTNLNMVNDFNTSKVTSMSNMFRGCTGLTSLNLTFDTSSVVDMSYMFSYCSLTSLDLSKLNTSNVVDMNHMFYYLSSTSLNLKLNTSNVQNMSSMFGVCLSLASLSLSNFDTSNVTDMQNMFASCRVLTSLDLRNFDTSNVADMQNMFNDCQSLKTLNVTGWNTSKVTNMHAMFHNCKALTSINVSSWNTSNVTDMYCMFQFCESLTSLNLSNFNTSNVTDMYHMFKSCKALTSLNVSNFDTSNVTNMQGMFDSCEKLTSLDLTSFDTHNVTNMQQMFYYSTNLKTVYVTSGKWVTEQATTGAMFTSCGTKSVTYK